MTSDFRIRFLDVGQGDAIVGILPRSARAVIVDVCDADRVLDFLESEGITEIVLFLTHSDIDHTRGAEALLTGLDELRDVTRVLAIFFSRDRLNATKGSEYAKLVRFIGRIERRLSRSDPRNPSADFNTVLNHSPVFKSLFDPVRVLVVHPEKADQDSLVGVNTNETAGVLLFEHTVAEDIGRRVLLTADVQLTGISLLLARIASVPVEANVIKYPHHGAWPTTWPGSKILGDQFQRRSMEDFFRHVKPAIVVFSVASDNPHKHIRPEALKLMQTYQQQSGRLLAVKWTQVTESCLRQEEPAVGEPTSAGDIEVRLGTYPDDDYVRVICSSQAG